MLARIAGGRRVDLMLIAIAESERPGVLRDDGTHPAAAELPLWWAKGAARSIAVLAPAAKRIVVIGDPPLPGSDVPACLSAHPDRVGTCEYARAKRAYLDADLIRAAAPALARYNVLYADLAPLLCVTSRCPVVTRDGVIMFKDAGHFTATFSRAMWPLLARAIDDAAPWPAVASTFRRRS